MWGFSIFNVKDVDGNPPERATRTDLLSQLQRAFHEQDDAEAGVQLERLWHVAKRICSEEGMSSADAWRKTIEDVSRLRKGPAYRALLPLLARFWAAGASTSGVEQSFSRARSLCDGLQLVSHINDTMEAWWFSCTDVWAFSTWYFPNPACVFPAGAVNHQPIQYCLPTYNVPDWSRFD